MKIKEIEARWRFGMHFCQAGMFILSLFRQQLKKESYVWYYVLLILSWP
jgi:hypothetical protein